MCGIFCASAFATIQPDGRRLRTNGMSWRVITLTYSVALNLLAFVSYSREAWLSQSTIGEQPHACIGMQKWICWNRHIQSEHAANTVFLVRDICNKIDCTDFLSATSDQSRAFVMHTYVAGNSLREHSYTEMSYDHWIDLPITLSLSQV